MKRKYEVGDYLFLINSKHVFLIDRINEDNTAFTYQYKDDDNDIRYSFWIEFDDYSLCQLFQKKDIIHIKTEKERLAVQLKYSCAI